MMAVRKKPDSDISQKKLTNSEQVDEIDKLVALTFDENPKIRLSVAQDLSNHSEDPRALLALLELSSDKESEISKTARHALGAYKKADEEAFTSLEKFYEQARKEAPETPQDLTMTQNRLMPSLEKLFSKNISAKNKLMPSLEKLFSSHHHYSHSRASDSRNGLEDIEFARSQKTILETVEESVGVPAKMQNPTEIKERRIPLTRKSYSQTPSQEQLEQAANFPLPDHLYSLINSPVASIPIMEGGGIALKPQEAEDYLPYSRLDYYRWAYALAITPGIKASDLKKEQTRLISEAKKSIEVAFKLAVSRAKEEGIESLSGLKPGMKKISTLPLEVLEHKIITIPKGKTKTQEMSRLLLTDGKHSMPLYVLPSRAQGIKTGDLVSLRSAVVDYQIKDTNATHDSQKGEIIFTLSKNGQMTITK